jgi:hypothetical protein
MNGIPRTTLNRQVRTYDPRLYLCRAAVEGISAGRGTGAGRTAGACTRREPLTTWSAASRKAAGRKGEKQALPVQAPGQEGRVSEREKIEEERRKLEAAGWEPRGRGPKTLWRNPADGRWYAQYRAIIILRRQRRGMEEESEP